MKHKVIVIPAGREEDLHAIVVDDPLDALIVAIEELRKGNLVQLHQDTRAALNGSGHITRAVLTGWNIYSK
jgi:hypothetical protein